MNLMKWLVIILTLSLASVAFASTCGMSYKSGKLSWTAFKTPKKVGVGAVFEDFSIKSVTASSIEALLTHASFKVNVASINSGDKARDAKIIGFFFKTAGKLIPMGGKVVSAKDGTAEVEFDINCFKRPEKREIYRSSGLFCFPVFKFYPGFGVTIAYSYGRRRSKTTPTSLPLKVKSTCSTLHLKTI